MLVEARSGINLVAFELNLFGGFDLHGRDGSPIALSSRKAKALLAYLTWSGAQPVSRAKAATLLWAGRGDEQARGSLRQTLSLIRKTLGDAEGTVLVASADTIAINAAVVRCDVAEFGRVADKSGREALESAAALYTGPFLDGFEIAEEVFEEWLRAERIRFAEKAERVIQALAGLYERDGDFEAALAATARLLSIDPLREETHRAAMRLFRVTGRWNEALRQYRECVSVLETELGVAPRDETRVLYEEILAQRELPAAADGDGAAGHDPAAPPGHAQDGRPSIAVLPFEPVGDDPDQSYFSDGITEDIITELSRFPGLFVIARNSSFAYHDRSGDPADLHREFGVRYVVKGSVRKSGNRVRVTAQLIEADSGKNIWAERYDRELTDIFALQDDLTRGIVAVLPGRIEQSEARKIIRKTPEIMAAYELLLAGKIHHHRFTREDCAKALDLIDRAISLEPDYAAAYAWKGCVLGQALGRGFLPDPPSLFKGAVEVVGTALRLDANEVEAHRIQSEIAIEMKDLDRAVRHNERALALNPNDPRLHAQKGELLTWLGEAGRGVDWIGMAMRLDPFSSPMWAHLLGRALMLSGRFAEAAEAFSKCAFPRFGYHADAAGCFAKAGMARESRAEAALTLDLKPDFTIAGYVAGLAHRHDDDHARHREILSAAPLPDGA